MQQLLPVISSDTLRAQAYSLLADFWQLQYRACERNGDSANAFYSLKQYAAAQDSVRQISKALAQWKGREAQTTTALQPTPFCFRCLLIGLLLCLIALIATAVALVWAYKAQRRQLEQYNTLLAERAMPAPHTDTIGEQPRVARGLLPEDHPLPQTQLLESGDPKTSSETPEQNRYNGGDADWLERLASAAAERLEDHNFTLNALSDALSISSRQLQRRLKAATGLTATQYLQEIRFQRARQLLISGQIQSVKTLAQSVGLRDVKYFSQEFKKRFGESPSEYGPPPAA